MRFVGHFTTIFSDERISQTESVEGPPVDLGVTWVCVHYLTWHQNDLEVD